MNDWVWSIRARHQQWYVQKTKSMSRKLPYHPTKYSLSQTEAQRKEVIKQFYTTDYAAQRVKRT
jgi:hypothetical protein